MAERYLISKASHHFAKVHALHDASVPAIQAAVPEGAAVPELVKLRQARDEKLAAVRGPGDLGF